MQQGGQGLSQCGTRLGRRTGFPKQLWCGNNFRQFGESCNHGPSFPRARSISQVPHPLGASWPGRPATRMGGGSSCEPPRRSWSRFANCSGFLLLISLRREDTRPFGIKLGNGIQTSTVRTLLPRLGRCRQIAPIPFFSRGLEGFRSAHEILPFWILKWADIPPFC